MKKVIQATALFGTLTLLLCTSPANLWAKVETLRTKKGAEVKAETLVTGLDHPWGMAFLPDGRLLITERNTGRLYLLQTDRKLSKPLDGVPKVSASGQGGLMDVALDPNFGENKYVYLSYAKPGAGGKASTALGRGRLADNRIENFEDIFVQEPYVEGSNHFGNRIEFSPDGSVPKDNPFVGQKNARGEIWSFGHRNIEAMAFQPGTGALWAGEMGPKGGDELNKIERGANYGWPVVSWGDHYDGRKIPDPPTRPEFTDAARHWTPVISPSGMVFYEGVMFPDWKHDALIGGLTSKELVRLVLDGTRVIEEDRLPLPERIRDVQTGPDGSIYLLSDQDNGKLWRISAPLNP